MAKQKRWSDTEIGILKDLFDKIPIQGKNSKLNKTQKIKQILNVMGFERTEKSIRRKLYRLGLVDFKMINEPRVVTKCSLCGDKITIQMRYYNNRDNNYCEKYVFFVFHAYVSPLNLQIK